MGALGPAGGSCLADRGPRRCVLQGAGGAPVSPEDLEHAPMSLIDAIKRIRQFLKDHGEAVDSATFDKYLTELVPLERDLKHEAVKAGLSDYLPRRRPKDISVSGVWFTDIT